MSKPPVRLKLLGGFALCSYGSVLALPTRKTEALLAYLVLARGPPLRREALVRLLWGAHRAEQGRNSLRQALTALRRCLGPWAVALTTGRETVTLDPDAVGSDVRDFEHLAASDHPDDLRAAAALYRGELLPGFEALHAKGFEEWRAREAIRLRSLAGVALLTVLADHEQREPGGGAEEAVARQLLELDPLQEPAHRALMRRYAGLGQPALALAQYERCRDHLASRLGAAPSPETERLREALAVACAAAPAAGPGIAVHPSAPGGAEASVMPPPLPDRPSLVVLPFQNMSSDPEQEYFADGMVEDLTTALSRIRWLFVIARNSSFTYKGRAVDVRQVGHELGVRYVLEGSVRRAGGRVRIGCQLVEATTGAHVWAERFEGDLADVFELQDRVTEAVAGVIEPSIRLAEILRARRKPTESLDAYDLHLRALPLLEAPTRERCEEAERLLAQAIQADPGFALARALAAHSRALREMQGWWHDLAAHRTGAWFDPRLREEGMPLARQAVADGRDDATALATAARALIWLGQDREGALAATERALTLNPNSALVTAIRGHVCVYVGRAEEAVGHIRRAIRLSPLDPEMSYFLSGLAFAHLMQRDYEAARAAASRAVQEQPGRAAGHRTLITALHFLDRRDEAMAEAVRYRALAPNGHRVVPERIAWLFADEAMVASVIEATRAAGLPD